MFGALKTGAMHAGRHEISATRQHAPVSRKDMAASGIEVDPDALARTRRYLALHLDDDRFARGQPDIEEGLAAKMLGDLDFTRNLSA